MFAAFLLASAHAACPVPIAPADLEASVSSAEQAIDDGDTGAFTTAAARSLEQLRCADAPLGPELAARLHRLVGLRSMADGHRDRAGYAFAATRAVDPRVTLPAVYPEGSPVYEVFYGLPADTPARALPSPSRGRLVVDGAAAERAPDRSLVLQWVDADAVEAWYLWPADPLPDLPFEAVPVDDPPADRKLWWAATGSALVGGALYGASWLTASRFYAHPDPAAAESLKPLNHTLFVGAAVGGAGALGFATAALAR